MIYRILHFADSVVARRLAALPENFQRTPVNPAGPEDAVPAPAVIVVEATLPELERALALTRRHPALEIVALAETEGPLADRPEQIYAVLSAGWPAAVIAQALANAYLHAQLRDEQERTKAYVARLTKEFQQLNRLGIRLSAEQDRAALLDLIVATGREITQADAGSLYLVEEDATGQRLTFTIVQNDSFPAPFQGASLPISSQSIAGHVALTGEVVNLEDAYVPPPGAPFTLDRSYDEQTGYRTRSMLAVPLRTPEEQIIGVLQLINCKVDPLRRFASRAEIDREARPFPPRYEDLACSLASQAAVALENSRLCARLDAALARLEASQQRVVRAERLRALGEMAGGLAHRFNNTLAVVRGRAQLMLRQTGDPDLQRQLRVIQDAALAGARTIRQIQEFARIRRQRPLERVDLNRVVEEAVDVTRAQWKDDAEVRGVVYDVRLRTASLPPVEGDPAELREALVNIILNGLDAMPAGGRLTLTTAIEGEQVVCLIADTGHGMPDEVRRRVFEPFFSTKGRAGSGLGLSLTYGVVIRHGGEVEAASEVGRGSTFTIRLPVAPAPAEAGQAVPGTVRPGARVLVIDDEPRVRDVLVDLLSEAGYRVEACADGRSGLARFEAERFDLVVTDLGMPEVTGWDVASEVKRLSPATPVIMVTGWAQRLTLDEARSRGADFLLAKPFIVDEVLAVMRRALGAGRRGGRPEGTPGA